MVFSIKKNKVILKEFKQKIKEDFFVFISLIFLKKISNTFIYFL